MFMLQAFWTLQPSTYTSKLFSVTFSNFFTLIVGYDFVQISILFAVSFLGSFDYLQFPVFRLLTLPICILVVNLVVILRQ